MWIVVAAAAAVAVAVAVVIAVATGEKTSSATMPQPRKGAPLLLLDTGLQSDAETRALRRAAMLHEVPCITTLTGAAAAVSAIKALRRHGVDVRALQDYHAGIVAGGAESVPTA